MKKDVPEVQAIYLTQKYIPARNNKVSPHRGDFPDMLIHTPNPQSVPRALANAYQSNRLADIYLVILEDNSEFTYLASEFQSRLSRFIGIASRPGMTTSEFLKQFTQPIK